MIPVNTGSRDPEVRGRWSVAIIVGIATLVILLGASWIQSRFDNGAAEGDVAELIDEYIAAWDRADGEAVVALMTPDGTHTCPLGDFSIADDDGERLIRGVESMADDDFEMISGPILSDTEAPLYAVAFVRISSESTEVMGIGEYHIVEHDGVLKIASSVYTHR